MLMAGYAAPSPYQFASCEPFSFAIDLDVGTAKLPHVASLDLTCAQSEAAGTALRAARRSR